MLKILLFGNGNSIFVKSYVEFVLMKLDAKIYLVTVEVTNEFNEFYEQNNIIIINNEIQKSFIRKIPKVRFLSSQYILHKKIRYYGKYDFCHIHFVNRWDLFHAVLSKHNKCKIILSFWGSDLFRCTEKDNKYIRKCLRYVDKITVSTRAMMDSFITIYGNQFMNKIILNRFGTTIYDQLCSIENSEKANDSKKKMNFPTDKVIVTCGYNGSIAQQHLDILASLSQLSAPLKDKVYIVVPMTYGTPNSSYEQNVFDAMTKFGFKGQVLNFYLDDADTARVRLCSDIFIHMQTTDALSASMQEHLIAGSIVLNGSWLRYEELEAMGVFFYKIHSIVDIANMINFIISDLETIKERFILNQKLLGHSLSWERVADKWLRLYSNS